MHADTSSTNCWVVFNCVNIPQFIISPIGEHSGCFLFFFPIRSNVPKFIFVHVSLYTLTRLSLRVESLSHKICPSLWENYSPEWFVSVHVEWHCSYCYLISHSFNYKWNWVCYHIFIDYSDFFLRELSTLNFKST